MKTIKDYIVYGGSPELWRAALVLENGWAAFGLIFNHPYMLGDLLLNRPERKRVFEAMGYEVEIVGQPIAGSDDVPEWLMENHKDESRWKDFADEYFLTEKALNETEATLSQ